MSDLVLRDQLRALRWTRELTDERGLEYRGPADFALREGKPYAPVHCHDVMGAQQACFGNAISLAILHGLAYVEGYALAPVPPPGLAIHHAWNVLPDGRMLDSTWVNTGLVYLGVEFHPGRADDATWNGDATVLDDFNRGWPILRDVWSGEDFAREWEPSELLKALSAGDLEAFQQISKAVRAGTA